METLYFCIYLILVDIWYVRAGAVDIISGMLPVNISEEDERHITSSTRQNNQRCIFT